MNLCSTCKTNPARAGQRNCASCHRAAQAAYRARYPQTMKTRAASPDAVARAYANTYLRRGKLVAPEACEHCSAPFQADRRMVVLDPAEPLVVLFVHRACPATATEAVLADSRARAGRASRKQRRRAATIPAS